MSNKVYPDGHLRWDEIKGTIYGDIPAVDITIPGDLTARIDLWKVPACEAYPEGIFVSVNSGSWYTGVEPGCNANEKHLLCKVSVSSGGSTEGGNRNAIAEYWNSVLPAFNSKEVAPDPIEVTPDQVTE